MREILCIGKRVDNGEWVEGYLIKGERTYIVTLQATHYMVVSLMGMASVEFVEVIPETVGQFTGLTDKNGKKIFEGDIVKNHYRTGKVVFNEKTCGFEFWCNIVVGTYGEKATHKCNFFGLETLEVIGNIHDNPELLEVE